MKDKFSITAISFYGVGALLAVWLAVLIAPYTADGLPKLLEGLSEAFRRPFHIVWEENSLKTILVVLLLYGAVLGVFLTNDRNYRRREEHGSAKWGNVFRLNRKYSSKDRTYNKVFTQNFSMGFNGRKHRRNLNTIVIGGSGAGKTRFFAKPNLLNAGNPDNPEASGNVSYVILDPKGELVSSTGAFLEKCGYTIKVLDLLDMSRSHCYNPFFYLEDDNDVQKLVTNLFQNTTPKGSQTSEPFWDESAMMLLKALMFYLHYEAPPEEQNFSMVLEMIRAGDVKEDNDKYRSPLDTLFYRLEMRSPDHIANRYYQEYRSGAAKTLKSIQITLLSHLEKFNLDTLAGITHADELELDRIGEERTALFAVIPDNDTSFNFIVGMLYTQLFQRLYTLAKEKYKGRLPMHVHFVMDEFANVSLPTEFDKLLATMRSREISVSIIIQNLAQLKKLFEKEYESILGNCDTLLYLGGNEQSTHEYISKLLGKETIDMNTYGRSKGRSGSYSTNWQLSGRELLDSTEVRLLDNRDALLFVRGERPVKDQKYDIMKHPNIMYTSDGGAEEYRYGEDDYSIAEVKLNLSEIGRQQAETVKKEEYLFFSDEEFEELLEKKRREK